jgi:hypothetical protein
VSSAILTFFVPHQWHFLVALPLVPWLVVNNGATLAHYVTQICVFCMLYPMDAPWTEYIVNSIAIHNFVGLVKLNRVDDPWFLAWLAAASGAALWFWVTLLRAHRTVTVKNIVPEYPSVIKGKKTQRHLSGPTHGGNMLPPTKIKD